MDSVKWLREINEGWQDDRIAAAADELEKARAEIERLKAMVPVVCEECNGTGLVPPPYGDDRDKGRTFCPCPECSKEGADE